MSLDHSRLNTIRQPTYEAGRFLTLTPFNQEYNSHYNE